jgi:hypothetical protein
MRAAFMFIQKRIAAYAEDMTLNAHAQPWHSGACRRR